MCMKVLVINSPHGETSTKFCHVNDDPDFTTIDVRSVKKILQA